MRYSAFVFVLAVSACGTNAEGRDTPPETITPVQMADVVLAGQAAAVTASGTLGAKDEVTLSFKIGGIVGKVLVDDGARVKRGRVLAALDQREIDAMLAKARAGAEKARRDAQRVERLYKDSVATLAQWQDVQTARDAAEADLRAARVNHEYSTITAPTDGVVLMRIASAGQMVGAGTPVIQFASNARGSVLRAGVPDRDAVRLAVGDRAEVTFEAVPGKVFTGKVTQVGAAADPRTGVYVVEIALAGVQALPSGLVGRAVIEPRDAGAARARARKPMADARAIGASGAKDASGAANLAGTQDLTDGAVYAIPAEALVEGDKDRGSVYTVDKTGTRARRVTVALVGLAGDKVLVRGLDGVPRVVRSGSTWLSDSARVEITP
ncbi:MAG: efflux RND transporter periplasmic adaptor subunit [Gemmatimonadetes bacterium]|nr:efflux RND transporter periplasmic adaptor subunit [Gemmatimonadota bacterium]